MGFGFPKAERDGLVASDPDTFFLPPTSDLRYQWVCAHLPRLDERRDARAGHRRLADVHAEDAARPARACRPPAMRRAAACDAGECGELRPLLHPYLQFTDGAVTLRGRTKVLDAPRGEHPTPRPPASVEVRDGADLPLRLPTTGG